MRKLAAAFFPCLGALCTAPAPAQDKAAVIKAADLTMTFAADEDAALRKHKDKEVVVEGKVLERSKEKVIDNFVLLEGHAKKGKVTYKVYCRFAFTDEADILKVTPGDRVTVRGIIRGGWGTEVDKDTLGIAECKFVK